MNNKTESLKEKLRQALSSTAKVISDDLGIDRKKNIKNSDKQYLIELTGKLGSCLILVNLSSCTAPIISEPFKRHAALS